MGDKRAELGVVAETVDRVDVAGREIAGLGEIAMLPRGMGRATYRIPRVDLATGRDRAGDDVSRTVLAAWDGTTEVVVGAWTVRLVDDRRVGVGADAGGLAGDDLASGREDALGDEMGTAGRVGQVADWAEFARGDEEGTVTVRVLPD